MKKLPKDKRDKIISISIGTVMVIAAVWYLLVNMQVKRLRSTEAKIAAAEDQVRRAELSLASAEKIRDELDAVFTELRVREEAMASGDMYAWIIQTVNRFKLSYNVDIPQFSREVAADVGIFPEFPYKAAAFTLRGSAHYHDFGRFIADFENAFPNIRLQNIELEPSAPAEERLGFKVDLLTLIKPTAL